MMEQLRRLSVHVALLVFLTLLASGLVSGWLNAARQKEMLVSSMRGNATILVGYFAESSAYFLILNDYAGLESFLLKSAEMPEITSLQVCEPDGKILSDVAKKLGLPPSSLVRPGQLTPPSNLAPVVEFSDNRMTVWQSIGADKSLGWIKAVFSLDNIRKAQVETLKNSLMLAIFWAAVSTTLLLIAIRPTAGVFARITTFARRLAENKGDRIEIASPIIELKELATSLNFASEQLAASERQLLLDRERLRSSEERYRQLLDTIQEGIWVIDKDSVTTFVNPRMTEILGYAPEEMLGQSLFAFMDEQGRTVAERNVERRRQGIKEQHDFEFIRKDGSRIYTRLETGPILDEAGQYAGSIAAVADITTLKQAELERLANLNFFESLDQVNRAIQGARDADSLMTEVLDLVLSIFACDRAFLLHPCDPEAPVWVVPMERTKAEFPGAPLLGSEIPMTAEVAETFRILLAANGPVRFGPGTPQPLPADTSERFGGKCFMAMALHPKAGKAWQFGIHQCSQVRIWTAEEERLFQEIGRRLSDGLNSLLASQELHRLNAELEARVTERTTELEAKNTALEKMNKLFVGRELRMVELKERLAELEKQVMTRDNP